MRKTGFLAILMLVSLILVSCSPADSSNPEVVESQSEESTEAVQEATEAPKRACFVTDVAGIDDKSFNATAWKGVLDAEELYGWEGSYLESQQQTDYEKNITQFVEYDCDLIIAVGNLLGDALGQAAELYPEQKFMMILWTYDPPFDNVWAQDYSIEEAAFLAGYVSASVTQTGKVGTFGGVQIPSVEAYMDGFALGVDYYNQKNDTDVEVLGWDVDTRTGLFVGNFESTDDGKRVGEALLDEGADIILPVAGPVGLGTAAAIKERGNAYLIGVDTDWTVSSPEYADFILTSVENRFDVSVVKAVDAIINNEFVGKTYPGTLADDSVGISPFHELDSLVREEVKEDLEEIKELIISGEIKVQP